MRIFGNRVDLIAMSEAHIPLIKRWLTAGEWKEWDAPWEESSHEIDADREAFARAWVKPSDSGIPDRFLICDKEGTPVGWVTRYATIGTDSTRVGLNITEDAALGRGLGTEALMLWKDFLLARGFHRVGLDTWSFNERMQRVAEKAGFTFEGREREVRRWQGEWLDLLHYGVLAPR